MPNGPRRKPPAWRSSSVPNTLGSVEARHAQPVDRSRPGRPARRCGSRRGTRSRRSAETARASPRSAARAVPPAASRCPLCAPCHFALGRFGRAHDCHPGPAPAAEAREQTVRRRRAPGARRVGVHGGRILEQRLQDPPGLLDPVLTGEARAVAAHRVEQQHLVGRRRLAALLGELHIERDRLRAGEVGAVGVEDHARAGRGIELDDELVGLGAPVPVLHEAEARRLAEHGAQLGLGHGQLACRCG